MEQELFSYLLAGWAAVAAITFISLLFIDAPYGRHAREGWGPMVNNRLGWLLMETPAAFSMLLFFLIGNRTDNLVAMGFLLIWLLHYLQRSLIYPFRLRTSAPMPLSIVAMGVFFNLVNGYTQGRYLFTLGPELSVSWLFDLRFIAGTVLFACGFVINISSDHILLHLRKPGEKEYKIPQAGLFRWISCPNYLGELMEWIGWAILTWSLPGLLFAVWTAANLVPRALAHHRWYQQAFLDYPRQRKALIPGVL